MTCHNCRIEMVKAGFYGRNKVQRYKCQHCGKRFAEPQERLLAAGKNCEALLATRVRNVEVRDVQADEVWTFVQKKEGHKWPHKAHDNKIGDAYTFIAIERHSKLILTWHLGRRDRINTEDFISKLRTATADCRFHAKAPLPENGLGGTSQVVAW